MEQLILFGTQGCHLCEEADALIAGLGSYYLGRLAIDKVDIAEQEQWQQKYAVRIPVLYHPQSDAELSWPFDDQALQDFFNELIHQ